MAAQIAKCLGYPPELWVLTALQDQVNEAGIKKLNWLSLEN